MNITILGNADLDIYWDVMRHLIKHNTVSAYSMDDFRHVPNVNSDLLVLMFYKRVIPAWFIDKFDRAINTHISILPEYRGARGINWALKQGRRRHGVTIHEVTPKLDQGPILSQMTFDIFPEFEEVIDVYERALDYAFVLFKHTMKNFDKITPRPQDESKATYYSSKDFHLLGDRLTYTKELSCPTKT